MRSRTRWRSDSRLADLADADLLITRTADGRSFRYHSLLRDLLARELARDPADELDARVRAASWYESAGLLDEAIDQLLAGGDLDHAARLVLHVAQAKYRAGEVVIPPALDPAFYDAETVAQRPDMAALGALVNALEGDAPAAAHWAAVVSGSDGERPASDPAGPGPGDALVSAMLCADGPERMLQDALRALTEHPADWPWRPTAVYATGMAALMLGQDDVAQARFHEVEQTPGIGPRRRALGGPSRASDRCRSASVTGRTPSGSWTSTARSCSGTRTPAAWRRSCGTSRTCGWRCIVATCQRRTTDSAASSSVGSDCPGHCRGSRCVP